MIPILIPLLYNAPVYSAKLLDHFQNPRHAGEVSDPTTRIRVENPVCGDILELTAVISDGLVKAIRFRAKGCVPSMACSSALCDLAWDQPLADLRQLTVEDIVSRVEGVPQGSLHAPQMVIDALQQLLRFGAQGTSAG